MHSASASARASPALHEDGADDAPEWFERALNQEPERSELTVDGVRIEVQAWGEAGAPGVLLIHGFRAHAGWWRHIAPLLSHRYRVLAASWSGMGRSGHRPEGYSLSQYAKEAIAVCESQRLFDRGARPYVVAHSLGGHVGTILAAREGHRLGGVVLLDTGLGPEKKKPPLDPGRRIYATMDEAVGRFRLTPAQEAKPYVVRQIASDSFKPAQDGSCWEWCFDPAISAKLARPHYWSLIPEAQCRLAFVRGEHSRIVSRDLEGLQRRQAPAGTPFVTVPAAGHHLMLDQPVALAATLEAVLAMWDA